MPSHPCSPFSQINIDHLIEKERQKLIDKANKQKQITLIKYAVDKERKESLAKQLDKKQNKAQKTVNKYNKDQELKRNQFMEKKN